jgi:AmmeMemoRadiSam system protein B
MGTIMTRKPTGAGMFYPANPVHLREMIASFFNNAEEMGDALGIVSPHAGYPYSGQISAYAYSAIPSDFQGSFIVIGPSHRGYSTCVTSEPYETPLGITEVDTEFIPYLDVTVDEFSHQQDENSLEVQIPFIQYRFPKARIAPILMGNQSQISARHLAEKIIRAIEQSGTDVRIVASSDFSHYVPDEVARNQDLYAIEALYSLDVEEFYRRLMEKGVSACGYGPIATMVEVCRHFGARKGSLVSYATSGDTTGDRSAVVGYAAITVM